ncbi:DUF2569 domain-containing protein [Sphingomicrobium sp. XHP0239]|uniref:DUF2569 domain-containing protein n=1 Tax=Sphingomicrobium maritimum TaxID=3133972 RepID=UPI0031CC78E1
MLASLPISLARRAESLHASLERNLPMLMAIWVVLALCGGALRVSINPVGSGGAGLGTIAPYLLLMGAPIVSMALALRWFADGDRLPQPDWRIARIGRWRDVDLSTARGHRLYGTTGIMVSLLVGMLMNVPMRAAEYLVAIPAILADVPNWLATLHFLMTLDVVLMPSLYVIAFVAALRRVPLFPRLLATVWLVDMTLQLVIADRIAATDLPPEVAASLTTLLDANVKKVMISVALWAPYLIFSKRVNVTYRHRVPA